MSDQVQPADPTQPVADQRGAVAYQPTVAERAAATKRRGQALIGAAAGLAVIAVLVGVFVWVQQSGGDSPAASAPAAAESAAPAPVPSAPAAVDPALQTKPVVKAGTGALTKLAVKPIILGTGPAITKGQTITVNYVGVSYKTGKQFDSTWERGQPFQTAIGVGAVIPGWDQGLIGAPVGTRVQLDIPGELAYGDKGEKGGPAGPLRNVIDVLAAQ